MDELLTHMPAPAANDVAPAPGPRADDGPDGLFNHYRLRRLQALGVAAVPPAAPQENAA